MNNKTLEQELARLKHYLKKYAKDTKFTSVEDYKIHSHTIVGMLMSIHNLIKTGAYNLNDFSHEELFETISQARHTAIHYGFFDDYSDIEEQAKKIVSNLPSNFENNFANSLKNINFYHNCPHYQISAIANGTIKESLSIPDFYILKNLKTQEEIYVARENLIIVENDLTHTVSYLFKYNDDEVLYYKQNADATTQKISFKELKENNPIFLESFVVQYAETKFDIAIHKILKSIIDNPYTNAIVNYKYNDKLTSITVHNLLQDILYKHTINEKVLNGHFSISVYENNEESSSELNIKSLPTMKLHYNATLTDIFYMNLFLKKYKMYSDLIEFAQLNGKELSLYAKQSMLLNLYEVGVSNISQEFLDTDKGKKVMEFYFQYKRIRNQLAHNATSSKEEKELLVSNMERYTETFYQLASLICDMHDKEKGKNKYSKLPNPHKLDEHNSVIYNKTHKFAKFKHNSTCKIINGKKYLKLDCSINNYYLEIDGSLLSLDYNTLISRECVVPMEHIHIVEINPNTNKITPAKAKVEPIEIIGCDQYMYSLLQAQEYLKNSPIHRKKVGFPYFSAITFYDKFENPIFTERVNNVIYRRLSQKIIPNQLLEASTLVIPNNIDEPLIILNKNKSIVAKVYWACINYIDGKEIISQVLQDKSTREIEHGKMLQKDLKTSDLIETIKEGRKQ